MVIVYISPNNTVNNTIKFLHKRLMIYGKVGSWNIRRKFVATNFSRRFQYQFRIRRLTLSFLVNLVNFLLGKVELQMNNNRNDPTTRHGTTIDAVFSRNISNFLSKTSVSYFSYHKHVGSVLKSTTVITDVFDNDLHIDKDNEVLLQSCGLKHT